VTASFSWNLVADLREMWSLPFMLNAFRAGTVVALLAGPVGWFMVLRRQSFAGHTLAVVGFPGAAAAVWLGVGVTVGYLGFCVLAALVLAAVPVRGHGDGAHSAAVGTVQALALAAGMVFVALYKGFLNGTSALLFGSFLGVTAGQVATLAVVAGAALVVLAAVGRPLLYASVDADVARAGGVPTRALGAVFLLLLALTAAEVGQVTGALLVFALLVLPPATARLLTARPARGLAVSVLLAVVTVWAALVVAYYSPYPLGFWLTTIGFGGYVLAYAGRLVADRAGRRLAVA
jgi:zinc/manganese transport system permease protein